MKNQNKLYIIISTLVVVVIALSGVYYYLSIKDVKEENVDYKNQLNELKSKLESNLNQNSQEAPLPSATPGGADIPISTAPNGPGVPVNSTNNSQQALPSAMAGNNGQFGQPNRNGMPSKMPDPNVNVNTNSNIEYDMNTSGWKHYSNKKYKYSFKYPAEIDNSNCSQNQCKYGKINDQNDDTVSLNGISSWPNITITYNTNPEYNLPDGKSMLEWVKEKFPECSSNFPSSYNIQFPTQKGNPKKGIKVNISQPDGKTKEDVFFLKDKKIFQIQLMDVKANSDAEKFYDLWIKNFEIGS